MGECKMKMSSEPFLFMSMFIFTVNTFTLPQLIHDRVCRNKYNDTVCSELSSSRYKLVQDLVQKDAAEWLAFIPLTALVPAVFILCMLGPFSDAFGIRKTMLIPPAISFLQSIMYLILTRLQGPFSPGMFIFGTCLSGLFGETTGCEALAMSYMAHVTSTKDRTIRMTLLESSLFLAASTGGLINGLILWKFGFTAVFICTAIVNSVNFLYVAILLPSEHVKQSDSSPGKYSTQYSPVGSTSKESDELPHSEDNVDANSPLIIKSIEDVSKSPAQGHGSFIEAISEACNPCKCFAKMETTVCSLGNKWKIITFLIFLFLALFPNMGEIYMAVLYLKHRPFNLSSREIGYLIAYKTTLTAFGMGIITVTLKRCFNITDYIFLCIGFLAQTIYFILLGVSFSTTMIYLIQLIGLAQAIHFPVLRSLISKQVDPDNFGTALAIAGVLEATSTLTTNLVSNNIYAATVSIYPGLAFLILSLVAFSAFIGSVIFYKKEKKE